MDHAVQSIGFGNAVCARVHRVCVYRSGARIRHAFLYAALPAIAAFLLALYWPGRRQGLSLILAAAALAAPVLFLLQQLSGRWIFNGGYLYFSSFFFAAEYKLSEFSGLSASRRRRGRVLALRLSSEYRYGEPLEFWFRDWRRQSLCELMSAILASNGGIQVNPSLAHIISLWAQPVPGEAPEAGAPLAELEAGLAETPSLPA
jgi:hypothetical protein